ncbi:Histidine kinase-, DNA gyrase B-, and HSP90-like ATPase [Chishuiella changwenlii]|uniref:histidine kinase n=1 Tax=Chishuiella changwenlii TaxID=1434701 RepID=A0A1M6Y0Y8_9FLAO|nr:HAMP domain-containing sensor histidine kinase [Chishuiella changwenlii]GGE93885.1 two-component sensor histidine kinase [Chishuiella changwenlii]SHL11824.1 Histidine kinase-, DNA gyrase B-, and HSP90-like ATPase [Chishuiella changwenlii]
MQNFITKGLNNRWIGFFIIFIFFVITIWSSNKIVQEFKKEEHQRVENYAKSLELITSSDFLDSKTQDFLFKLIEDNKTIPVALVDEKGNISDTKNIDRSITEDSARLKHFVNEMKKSDQIIEVELIGSKNYVYFKNSKLLNQLRYYPFIIILLIISFFGFTYWYFKTVRETEKSFLWAGMAKETAHQIGTPLSSLMGWVELLKLENIDPTTVDEIEKDVDRLNHIANRFSKIGSRSELTKNNIVGTTQQTVNYISQRISKGIEVNFKTDVEEFNIKLNESLYSWVIENLMKNAADAMQNKGVLDIIIYTQNKYVEISIKDTGSGIPSKLQKKIFEPGFTTKKRGWGLGLSLAKRIIEEYHNGKIFVAKSTKETGTEFKILLRK